MLIGRFVGITGSVVMTLFGAGFASCEDYPNKPIRIVLGAPGGTSDILARLIAQGLTGPLRQPVVIDNRGGSVAIPAQIVANAPPDGYTMLINGGSFWVETLLQKMPYDPVNDFSPITMVSVSPNVVVVHPSVAAKSIKDLIALAKAKPGALNFASGGGASSAYLAAELFKAMAGVNMTHIPYKGQGPATIDLVAGQVQLMFATAPPVAPHIKAGKLRALAVTTAQPSALFPDLSTVAAAGLPGYEAASYTGSFAPAKTPVAVIGRLNQEIVRYLKTADTKERLLNAGVEPVGGTPAELAAKMKSELATLGKVIKDAGIKAD